MIFTVLGSCSGTEPMPGRHQTSVTLELDGGVYFFDAGENCGYASYNAGIDQAATRAIFISHPHMDHIGGLPHLLWNIRKITYYSRLGSPEENRAKLAGRTIPVFLSDPESFDGVWKMLKGSEGGYDTVFTVEPRPVVDGVLLDDGRLYVEAFHNYHLGEPKPGQPWRSHSFELRAQGKKVLYSGDFRDLDELLPHCENADLIFLETGHHRACELCRELVESGISFGKVMFFHHGLEILGDFDGELALAKEVLGGRVDFAQDGTRIEL